MSLEIKDHSISKRIKVIQIQETELDKLIFPFNKHSIQSLEYKPFSRFSLAKSVDNVFSGELSKVLNTTLKDRNTGTAIIEPDIKNSKFDKDFLVKLSTALVYLVGLPNFDSMTGKYYARFHVKHSDSSDSYLRKAYRNLDLHTDGTFVKEKTDWLLMTKMEEINVKGGESTLLHLDDLENLKELSEDPLGRQNFIWGSPKSKKVDYKVEHPVFKKDEKGNINISYIDQFPEPKSIDQGVFLQRLSDALEESDNKILTELPIGSSVVANNHFWLHGRKPFKVNKNLSRELLRIRGSF